MKRTIPAALALGIAMLPLAEAGAHPIPRLAHDRTIVVRLTQQALVVDYRLELDEVTLVYNDLKAILDEKEREKLLTHQDLHDAFTRGYAPILADNLIASLDGTPLQFQCVERADRLLDEAGKSLDHLRFDLRFRSPWQLDVSKQQHLEFREANYELQEGMIRLSLVAESSVEVITKTEPEVKLQERPTTALRPGDDERRRKVAATFRIPVEGTAAVPETPHEPAPAADTLAPSHLLDLLLDPSRGFWMLLLLAAGFGAVHALTPGHGKTLVAAYLVGERGTVWHAFFLGLVTTLTHTGAVLALAAVLLFVYPDIIPDHVRTALGMVGGLLVAGMGLWLLLRRLSNQADHVHIGGSGHHHHHHGHHEHDHASHYHDAQGPPHYVGQSGQEGGWWGLIVLGVSGGIVPCWDAIAMFGFGVSAQRLGLALQLLLAFSAGLAAVLIVIGVLVVRVKGFAGSRWGSSRAFKALPVLSALCVTVLGLWLCFDSVHR
jgi:ABC-type nickel/cobalt efflux system permease component RcnA